MTVDFSLGLLFAGEIWLMGHLVILVSTILVTPVFTIRLVTYRSSAQLNLIKWVS